MSEGDLSGAVLDGRYKVIAPVAEGAMGVVYRAERLKLGRIVAVKVLHDSLPNELSSRKRFEIEAMAMAKLEHPHCAAVLDVGLHDGKPFVVMDFVSGEDLKSLIARGPVTIPRALEILRQTLSGLAHAHELGIIHRDIKPANIILSQKAGLGDHVTILDFGLARLTQNQGASLTTGIVVGTPAYMAPEQIRGTVIDGRVDMYACGVLLFELVTGKKPFHSEKDDPIEVVSMHLKNPPPRLADMRPGVDFGELEDIVAKALQKNADDRYQTATEFVAALDSVGRGRTMPGPAPRVETSAITDAQPEIVDDSLSIPVDPAGTRLGLAVATMPLGAQPATGPTRIPPTPVPTPVPVPRAPTAPPAPPAEPSRSIASATPATAGPPLKKIAIGGAAVLALIIIIAVAAGGKKHEAAAPADATVAVGSAEPVPTEMDPAADAVAHAEQLVAGGDPEAALSSLLKARREFPQSGAIPYLAGKLYFNKLWWTDGLKSFKDAIRVDPAYKSDPELLRIVLRGFITTPRYNDELASFLRNELHDVAQEALTETAKDHPNPQVRARAKDELRRYR